MSALTQTLGDMLLTSVEAANSALESPALDEVRTRLATRTNLGWPTIAGTCTQALRSALNIRVLDVLVGGWSKLTQLQAYLDRDRYPSDQFCRCALLEHTIRSVHNPRVEILLEEAPIDQIVFELEFLLTVEGIVLSIRDARIVAIGTGTYEGGGALKFNNFILLEAKTQKYDVPGVLELGEGIAIPHLA